jgi:hypothetical protein
LAHDKEELVTVEKPYMYTDMSERDFIKWNLEYSMPRVLAVWDAIPEEQICRQPKPYLAAPAFVFGNIAVKERIHHAGFAGGVNDIPKKYAIFHGFKMPTQAELEAAVDSKQALVDYWKDVRKKTLDLLSAISDADLKKVPDKSVIPDGQPNRDNPIREAYVMSIMNQNVRWGELRVLHTVIENEIIGNLKGISPSI